MADKTNIEWAEATWNPLFGCSKVSPGCANCYAETFALNRMKGKREYTGLPWTPANAATNVQLRPERLDQPIRWRRPRRIFVNSLSDLFHELVPDEFIDRVFAVMAMAQQHQFLLLTKRPQRMRAYMERTSSGAQREFLVADQFERVLAAMTPAQARTYSPFWRGWPLPNVWLGVSVENARWRTRIDELRHTPAAVRFISAEPLLGPLTIPDGPFAGSIGPIDLTGIHWLISGGESGPGARPLEEQWLRDLRDECAQQGVAFFHKQMGEVWSREHLNHGGHAGNPAEWPEDLRVREYPQ